MKLQWNDTDRGRPKYTPRKTCTSSTPSTTNPTRIGLGSNCCLWRENSTSKCRSLLNSLVAACREKQVRDRTFAVTVWTPFLAPKYRVIRNDCRGFNNLPYTIHFRQQYMYFYVIEQHSQFLLHTLQVLYMCTLCDSTDINTIIELVPNCLQHVSGDGFNGGSDSYLQFRDTHAPCLLKLCIPPSNGIVRWWFFPEFGAELPLHNYTPTIMLNNPVFYNFVTYLTGALYGMC